MLPQRLNALAAIVRAETAKIRGPGHASILPHKTASLVASIVATAGGDGSIADTSSGPPGWLSTGRGSATARIDLHRIGCLLRSFRAGNQSLIWALIATLGMAACALSFVEGMSLAIHWGALALITFACALGLVVSRFNPPAARLSYAFAQIFTFAHMGGYLSYVAMAASPFPLADRMLSHADAALGFDWLAWFRLVNAHPALHAVLAFAYSSIPLQLLVVLIYFSYVDEKRIDELLLTGILSAFLIIPAMMAVPAVGAWSQNGVGIEPWRADILALKAHTLLHVTNMQGIISFPSFHTVLGVLLANAARGQKWSPLAYFLNLLLVASVMTQGAHYFVDLLSGLVVAAIAVAISRWIVYSRSARSAVGASEHPAMVF